MSEQQSSYRQIMKATSLFGGLQVYQIIISIIRTKFIALLLEPEGMGINGLYRSSLDLVRGFTSMGITKSAVRDVSEANGTGNQFKINQVIAVVKKLVWVTGIFGMVTIILLSPGLSKATFGNYNYIIPFIFLSIILLLEQLKDGQNVLLQGLRRYSYLAKASAIGVTVGMIVTIPLYYFLGVKGIVPALIATSLISFILSRYYSNKVGINNEDITLKKAFLKGKSMFSLGIVMSINNILVLGSSYIVRIFISHRGGIEQVGLYSAGFAIIGTYVGLIFNAMTIDYYPRLAAVNNDNKQCVTIINNQAEIAILILSPLILLGIAFTPIMLKILYTNQFLAVNNFVKLALAGTVFKAISWCISYVFIAMGDKKTFMTNEIIANILFLLTNLVAFILWGLTGLGISYIVNYIFYTVLVYYAAVKKIKYQPSSSLIKLFLSQIVLIVSSILSQKLENQVVFYSFTIIIIAISILLSIDGLNKRLNLIDIFKYKFRK